MRLVLSIWFASVSKMIQRCSIEVKVVDSSPTLREECEKWVYMVGKGSSIWQDR